MARIEQHTQQRWTKRRRRRFSGEGKQRSVGEHIGQGAQGASSSRGRVERRVEVDELGGARAPVGRYPIEAQSISRNGLHCTPITVTERDTSRTCPAAKLNYYRPQSNQDFLKAPAPQA